MHFIKSIWIILEYFCKKRPKTKIYMHLFDAIKFFNRKLKVCFSNEVHDFYLPTLSTPIRNWTIPQISVITTDTLASFSSGEAPNAAVIRDMMAVGPRVMSFEVPMNV